MREDELKAAVIDLAERNGWYVYSIRRSDQAKVQGRRGTGKGYPDLTLLHPKRKKILFVELKSADGKITPGQGRWLEALTEVDHVPFVEVWRPDKWLSGHIERVLRYRPATYEARKATENGD